MEIIRVFHQDAKAISSLYATSWKVAYKDILPHSYLNDLSNERWLPMFRDSTIACFALKEHGDFVATISLSLTREETTHGWGEIISLYVLPKHFHKGYGSHMLSFAIRYFQEEGLENIYLWVLEENNQACTFYKKHNFYPRGDKKNITILDKEFIVVAYCNSNKK